MEKFPNREDPILTGRWGSMGTNFFQLYLIGCIYKTKRMMLYIIKVDS